MPRKNTRPVIPGSVMRKPCPAGCGNLIQLASLTCPGCWRGLPPELRDAYLGAAKGSPERERAAVVITEYVEKEEASAP